MKNVNVKFVQECDYKEVYGYYSVTGVTVEELRSKITEIKSSFIDETSEDFNDDYCLEDFFRRLPKEWKFERMYEEDRYFEIVEV